MDRSSDPHEISTEAFQRAFAAVSPLIEQEWPDLDTAALQATRGDLEQVTVLVAKHADRPRLSIRRHLAELFAIATRSKTPPAAESNGAPPDKARMKELVALVQRLEALAAEQAERVTRQLLPKTEAKVKQNIWISLLVALGLGLILGLWLNGRQRGGGRHG